jgi:hypothetical protein
MTFYLTIYDFSDHFGGHIGRHLEFDVSQQTKNATKIMLRVKTYT